MALYYTDSEAADVNALRLAIAHAIYMAKTSKTNQCALAVGTKWNLRDATIFAEVLGGDAVKEMLKVGYFVIEGCRIFLLTRRIDPSGFIRGPIVAAHIAPDFLDKLLKNRKATDIIYVPWMRKELQHFLADNPSASKIE